MLEIGLDTEFVLSENIILKQIRESDQYYAFDVETGDHYSLNATAYWALDRVGHKDNFGAILEDFSETYDLKKQDALRDLVELMESALENKIISRRNK